MNRRTEAQLLLSKNTAKRKNKELRRVKEQQEADAYAAELAERQADEELVELRAQLLHDEMPSSLRREEGSLDFCKALVRMFKGN